MRTGLAVMIAAAVIAFARLASADLAVPPRVTQMNAQNTPLTKAGYLDATLYEGYGGDHVDPTGKVDSTAGIQQAIDDALTYAMVAYLPPGTYLVSDTLAGEALDASGQNVSCLNHAAYGTPFSAPQSPSLVGTGSGPRPVLKLAPGAPGFGDASNPKPLVHFWLQDKYAKDWQGDAACLMWAVLRDVDIDLGSGNAGAVGVEFAAAQYSYIENVSVKATGAYAGFQGVPSTNVVVNVAVDGGQYGVIPATCCGISLVGVTLKNQTVAALSLSNFGATMVTGFDIQQSAGSAVINTFFASQTSEVALLDGAIRMSAVKGAAIDNSFGHDLYASNVYVTTPGSLVQSGSQPAVPSSGGLDLLSSYSFTDATAYTQSGETQTSYAVIDGVKGQNEAATVAPANATPGDLVSRHLPGPLPWFEDSGVVDVTTLGADPTGNADSTAAIQQAIQKSDYVFVPRGDYIVSATLVLRPSTHLFGVPGMRSRLRGSKTWDPKGQYLPVLQSADTVDGATQVGDIDIELPDASDAQTYLSGVAWTAGRNSVTRQLAVMLPWTNDVWNTADRKLVHIQGHGGGRWYGLQQSLEVPARTVSPTKGFRNLLVENTTAPLTLYGPNPEHARTEPQFEFSHVSNVRVLGIKTEATLVVSIESSDNVMFAAHSGHDGIGSGDTNLLVTDSRNVAMPANQIFSGMGTSPQGFIVREVADGGTVASVPANDQCSYFERGTFDANAFPHCGDGYCDAVESPATCPADCAGDAGAGSGSGDGGAPGSGDDGSDASAGGGGDWPNGAQSSSSGTGCACATAAASDDARLPGAALVTLATLAAFVRRRRRAGRGQAFAAETTR
jgi:MYXO-CTERM domain-containing protein